MKLFTKTLGYSFLGVLFLSPVFSVTKQEKELMVTALVVDVLDKNEIVDSAVFQAKILKPPVAKKGQKPRYQSNDEVEVLAVFGENVFLEMLQPGATCFALMSTRPVKDQDMWQIVHIKTPKNSLGRIVNEDSGLNDVSDEMKQYLNEIEDK